MPNPSRDAAGLGTFGRAREVTHSNAHEVDARRHWDQLHAQARFRPRFPSDHVVRFALGEFPEEERMRLSILDIGVGGGRHTKLLCDLGFQVSGVDISQEGLRHCQAWLEQSGHRAALRQGSMSSLPFGDEVFDGAIAFGVFYYSDVHELTRSIAELRRVLRADAPAMVVMRTTTDYRAGKGDELEPGTYRLTIADTNEFGSVQHFLAEDEVPALFSAFSVVRFEKTETTFGDRRHVNSDWLIRVRR
jgi:SAM-dependent methyltransferase